MQHEVAQEPRRRPLGERGGGEAAQHLLAAGSPREGLRERLGGARRAPHRVALDDNREQHQAAAAIGILGPRPRGRLPAGDRAREQRARGDGAVRVRRQPARPEPVDDVARERRHARPQLLVAVRALPRQRAVDVGAGERLAAAEAAGGEPRVRHGRRSELGMGELDQPAGDRVVQRGERAADRGGGLAGVVEVDDHAREPGRRGGDRIGVRAAGDQRAQPERRAALARHQVDVVEHAEQPAAGIEHEQVADAVVEHLDQRLGPRAVGRERPARARSSPARAARPGPRPRPARASGCRGR